MFTKIIAGTALIAASAASAHAFDFFHTSSEPKAVNQLGQKLSNRQLEIQKIQAQIKNASADDKAMLQNRLTSLQNTTDQQFQNAIMHPKGNFLPQQMGQKLSNRQLEIQKVQEQIKNAPADQKAMLQNRLTGLQNTTDEKFQNSIMNFKGNLQQAPANAQQDLKNSVKSAVSQKLDNSKLGQAYQKYQNAAQEVQQDKQEVQDLKSSAQNAKSLLKGW